MDGLDGVQLRVHFISSPEVEVASSIALDIQFSSVDIRHLLFFSASSSLFVLVILCSITLYVVWTGLTPLAEKVNRQQPKGGCTSLHFA